MLLLDQVELGNALNNCFLTHDARLITINWHDEATRGTYYSSHSSTAVWQKEFWRIFLFWIVKNAATWPSHTDTHSEIHLSYLFLWESELAQRLLLNVLPEADVIQRLCHPVAVQNLAQAQWLVVHLIKNNVRREVEPQVRLYIIPCHSGLTKSDSSAL